MFQNRNPLICQEVDVTYMSGVLEGRLASARGKLLIMALGKHGRRRTVGNRSVVEIGRAHV